MCRLSETCTIAQTSVQGVFFYISMSWLEHTVEPAASSGSHPRSHVIDPQGGRPRRRSQPSRAQLLNAISRAVETGV
jgi:hypothetical protein